MSDILLRLPDVIVKVKLSRATIYRQVHQGRFPPPRQLSTRCVRWLQSEIDRWIESRPVAGNSPD